MHFISQTRYNPRTQSDDQYYRIKESFRDLTGRVRCRVMLNVGFLTPCICSRDLHDIGRCLSHMYGHSGQPDLFGNVLAGYNETVRAKSQEYWERIQSSGAVDEVRDSIGASRAKAERLVDAYTVRHTDPVRWGRNGYASRQSVSCGLTSSLSVRAGARPK